MIDFLAYLHVADAVSKKTKLRGMNAIKSVSVTVDARSFAPWSTQYVHVEDQKCYRIIRPLSLTFGHLRVRDLSGDTVFSVSKEKPFVPTYVMNRVNKSSILIRKAAPGYWVCEDSRRTWEVHRYSSIKCILSTEGRQMAIMSLSAGLPFVDEGKVYLRVHDSRHLDLAVAVALLVDGFSLNLNPILLNNNKIVTTAQSV